jgi:hypothetical protein
MLGLSDVVKYLMYKALEVDDCVAGRSPQKRPINSELAVPPSPSSTPSTRHLKGSSL